MTQFLLDNILLVALTAVSGTLLLFPGLLKSLGAPTIDTLAATQLINSRKAILVDVRAEGERGAGVIPKAELIPMADMPQRAAALVASAQPKGGEVRPIVLVCGNGMRSGAAARHLKKAGATEVFTLDGGFEAWRQAGLPVTQSRRS